MNAHLLVFDGTQIERTAFRDKIDALESVKDWTLFFGNTMYLASEQDARALSTDIRRVLPDIRFVLTKVETSETGGWLSKELWQFLKDTAGADADA